MRRLPRSRSRSTARTTARLAAPIVALVAALALLGSCAGERPTLGQAVAGTAAPATDATSTTAAPDADPVPTLPGSPVPGPDTLVGFIATPLGEPVVRTAPVDTADAVEVPERTAAGAPTTFAVLGDPATVARADGWLPVLLPTRPNGAVGWVPESSVSITRTPFRLLVDLAGRSLVVQRDGAEVLRTEIAVGTAENPTPTGASYVTELIESVEPDGAYGPYAFGLALHSDTLTEFAGGPGQVGIHGTDAPDLIGQAVSHGCVRLTNEAVQQLVDLQLPLGVPVLIS